MQPEPRVLLAVSFQEARSDGTSRSLVVRGISSICVPELASHVRSRAGEVVSLTQHDVVLSCVLLDQIVAVEVSNHNLDGWVFACDLLGLVLGPHESRVFVVGVLPVKSHKGVSGDVASDSGAVVTVLSPSCSAGLERGGAGIGTALT